MKEQTEGGGSLILDYHIRFLDSLSEQKKMFRTSAADL
jgi:hypothetical protein